MAFQNAPRIASVAFRATYLGRPVANVLNFEHSDEVTPSNLEDLVQSVTSYWGANMLNQLDQNYVMGDVVGTDLSVQNSFQYTDSSLVGDTGAYSSGGPLPSQAAFVITFRTGQIGRAYRGRMYVTGLNEGITTGNEVNTAWADATLDAVQAVTGAPALGGWTFVVLSRYLNGVKRSEGIGTAVTSILWRDKFIDTQRRRAART